MNPALHHPSWYRNRDLITDVEEKHALEEGDPMLLPLPQPFATFDTGSFRVRCEPGMWEISSSKPNSFNHMIEIAEKLFDETLPHTPVNEAALGFSLTYNLEKARRDRALKLLAENQLFRSGLSEPKLVACALAEEREGVSVSVEVTAARNVPSISVHTIFTFKPPARNHPPVKIGYWKLKECLDPHFEVYRKEANERGRDVFSWFKNLE